MKKRFIITAVMALAMHSSFAIEMEGIKFDDTAKVGATDLVANGIGVRSKFGKRYVAVLYVPAKSTDAEVILAAKGPKRIALQLIKDSDGKTFANALSDGIKDNASEAELVAIKDRLAAFSDLLKSMGDVAAGTVIVVDSIPDKGMLVTVGGKPLGKEIVGEDFFRALLKVWLGKDPVQSDLKAGLLGKPA